MQKQWEQRVGLFKFTYSYLLNSNNSKIKETILDFFSNDFDPIWIVTCEYVVNNYDKLITIISQYIASNWRLDRCSMVDQALLIAALAESEIVKTPKAVIIDQTLITCKKYSEEKSPEFINAILEKLL